MQGEAAERERGRAGKVPPVPWTYNCTDVKTAQNDLSGIDNKREQGPSVNKFIILIFGPQRS